MISDQIKNALAPCGLNCEKCFAHIDGDIRKHSLKLKKALANFDVYAKRFETMLDNPIFKHYPEFKKMLDYFASENCKGCRNEQCKLFKECGVRACHQEKQLEYCFLCDQFPCNKTNFDKHLYERWILLNQKIQKEGIDLFYERTKAKPRYL